MLDEKSFEEILRKGLDDDSVTNVTIRDERPAVGKGENFLSKLSRYTLGYSTRDHEDNRIDKEIQLIVKYEPTESGPGLEMIKQQNIFDTELRIFDTILPAIEKLVGETLAPKCFYGSSNPHIIVLQDLVPLGFKTKNRQRGLSMDHMLMVLDRIAKFHAGSVYLFEQNPDTVRGFKTGIITEHTPKNMFRVLEQTLEMVSNNFRRCNDSINLRTADKLMALKHKFTEEILKVTEYDGDEFCVLNHGDCWINNLMFREDEDGKPLEVMLIDFQMSVYSSPVIDLVYFLSVCPELDLKCDKDDFFLGEYLRVLKRTMAELKCKTRSPTIEELRKSMLKRRMWSVMAAITFYPRMIADEAEIESFDEFLESGETKMNIFKNPNASVALRKQLPVMDEGGYLD